MIQIKLIGKSKWTEFADRTLRAAGIETIVYTERRSIRVNSRDLIILNAGSDHKPSEMIGRLLTQYGPLRILVVDARADYFLAADAARACAVGYERCLWNSAEVLQMIRTYRNKKLPTQIDIDRRFATW